MIKVLTYCSISLLVLTGCAGGLSKTWVQPGVDYDTFVGNVDDCIQRAKEAEKSVGQGYSDGTPAGAFGAGFARGMSQAKASADAQTVCFEQYGYAHVDMSEEQKAGFKKLKSKDEKLAYLWEISNGYVAE